MIGILNLIIVSGLLAILYGYIVAKQILSASPGNSKKPLVNGGVYIIARDLLNIYKGKTSTKFSLEGELLPELFKNKKRVAGFLSKTTFIDIGLPQDYNRAAKVLSRHCGTF